MGRKEKDVSEFLRTGKFVESISVGDQFHPIGNHIKWTQNTKQEGDIPGLFVGVVNGMHAELSVISGIIVGISVGLGYDEIGLFFTATEGLQVEICCELLPDLLKLFNHSGIGWVFDAKNTSRKSVGVLLDSGVLIQFTFGEDGNWISHLGIFDWNLYRSTVTH